MFSPKTFAFVDESGDTSLQLAAEGVSTHYIVAVVLVKGSDLLIARDAAEAVRRTYFQSGEMKSSSVGANDERRIRVLFNLIRLPLSVFAFVVDKRLILKDSGLIFKKPFIKFLTGKVYNRIFRTFPNIDVIADEHGNSEFMESVRSYVLENHLPSLFESSSFSFGKSVEDPLIQVADMMAGSVARLFDAKRRSEHPERILEALSEKLVSLEEWPPVYHGLSEQISTVVAADHDGMVREYCKNRAAIYLQELDDSDEDNLVGSAVLTYLADQSRYPETDRYISGAALLSHLEDLGFGEQSLYLLRSQVIAHYRDRGVIVASNSNGYKIPTQVSDISNYVTRCDAVIQPMIERLRHAREQIMMMSHGEMDILAADSFGFLKRLVDHVQTPNVMPQSFTDKAVEVL